MGWSDVVAASVREALRRLLVAVGAGQSGGMGPAVAPRQVTSPPARAAALRSGVRALRLERGQVPLGRCGD